MVDIVYLDFAKAFDKVPNKRIVTKFRAHSIDGNLLNWIESWLSDRRQRRLNLKNAYYLSLHILLFIMSYVLTPWILTAYD